MVLPNGHVLLLPMAFPVLRSEERRVGKETRSLCDWSSDVCSSDLGCFGTGADVLPVRTTHNGICQSHGGLASTSHRASLVRRICTCSEAAVFGDVWSSPMGTSFFYPWLSRF